MSAPGDSFEPILAKAHALMRSKRGEEACIMLAEALEQARGSGDMEGAALFSSVRGSYLRALGRHAEALDAYLEAETLSGGESQYRISAARHMVFGVNQPERAIEKLSPLIKASQSSVLRQEAHSLRGIAFLALGKPREAVEELEGISTELGVREAPWSRDLSLAELLVRNSLGVKACKRYLSLIAARAAAEGEAPVLDKIRGLARLLGA